MKDRYVAKEGGSLHTDPLLSSLPERSEDQEGRPRSFTKEMIALYVGIMLWILTIGSMSAYKGPSDLPGILIPGAAIFFVVGAVIACLRWRSRPLVSPSPE